MTQPDYVPVSAADRVRPVRRLPAPEAWSPDRPGDLRRYSQPTGTLMGVPGPDQGYALALAERIVPDLVLVPGEHADDVVQGAVAIALRRAAMFGRAPVIHDIRHALSLFGFLSQPDEDLVELRRALFAGAAHDYVTRRRVEASPTDQALLSSPAEVDGSPGDWRHRLSPHLPPLHLPG
ncbi:MAG: hypothetical protein M0Z87_09590 [Actinomycetota bacterium]|nr:hypothetical protein [Actinomycetota bacterium]